jgi:1-acyl-sn-glycerol-3-phosphate acyltransferase
MVQSQMDWAHVREIHNAVLSSQQVCDAVQETPSSSLGAARRMVERILGVQRNFVLAIVGFLVELVFRLIYPMGMHIDEESLGNLRRALAETGRTGSDGKSRRPVILLPTHKSHVDYLALGLLFSHLNLPSPLVVAGDNLNFPVAGFVLHSGGALFIRRSFAGDRVYSAVFNQTVNELLRNNHILGCFIEGGRSRSGKLLTPKAGFLKAVVDSVLDGNVEDALLVPIAFSYGRVVEARSMMQEMSGGVKKKEAFLDSLTSIIHLIRTGFWGAACYGSIEISVAKGFSVRDHLRSREAAPASSKPELPEGFDLDAVQQPGTAVYRIRSSDRKALVVDSSNEKKTRVQLALSLGFRSLHESNRVGVIQGTALVGTILLMHKDRGLKISDLVHKVEWLTNEIISRGGRVQSTHSVEDTVAEVVDKIMWGSGRARLVKKHKSVVMTGLFTPMETLELSTFRNNLIHLFVQDAVVAVAMHSALLRGLSPASEFFVPTEPITPLSPAAESSATPVSNRRPESLKRWVSLTEVSSAAQFLSVLLKHEFIYRPIVNAGMASPASVFSDNFRSITNYMQQRDVIEVRQTGDEGSPQLTKIGEKGADLWEFLCGLLFPFIDSYYLTLLGCFVHVIDPEGVEMNCLVAKIQELGENLYMNNLLDHYDAIAKDTVNNALTAFADIGIISVVAAEDTREKRIKLKVPKSEVLQTIELLHSFRKGRGKIGSETPHLIADAIDLGRSL